MVLYLKLVIHFDPQQKSDREKCPKFRPFPQKCQHAKVVISAL